jgi:hypothetical protein
MSEWVDYNDERYESWEADRQARALDRLAVLLTEEEPVEVFMETTKKMLFEWDKEVEDLRKWVEGVRDPEREAREIKEEKMQPLTILEEELVNEYLTRLDTLRLNYPYISKQEADERKEDLKRMAKTILTLQEVIRSRESWIQKTVKLGQQTIKGTIDTLASGFISVFMYFLKAYRGYVKMRVITEEEGIVFDTKRYEDNPEGTKKEIIDQWSKAWE